MLKEKEKKKRCGYAQADVNSALEAVKNRMSLRIASATFGVPKSTLYTKNKETVPIAAKMDSSTYLTKDEKND